MIAEKWFLLADLVVLLVVGIGAAVILREIWKVDRQVEKHKARAKQLDRERQIILRATDVTIRMQEVIAVGESFEFGSSRSYLHVGSIVATGDYGYARITEHYGGGNFKAVRVL